MGLGMRCMRDTANTSFPSASLLFAPENSPRRTLLATCDRQRSLSRARWRAHTSGRTAIEVRHSTFPGRVAKAKPAERVFSGPWAQPRRAGLLRSQIRSSVRPSTESVTACVLTLRLPLTIRSLSLPLTDSLAYLEDGSAAAVVAGSMEKSMPIGRGTRA
jgi:hypothetical protein